MVVMIPQRLLIAGRRVIMIITVRKRNLWVDINDLVDGRAGRRQPGGRGQGGGSTPLTNEIGFC